MNSIQLEAFRFVLDPIMKLSKKKQLHELFYDEIEKKFREREGLAYLCFGLSITEVNFDSLLECLESNISVKVTDTEVSYRKLLVEIARDLATDPDTSKEFIHFVVKNHMEGTSLAKFMPPEHEHENNKVYFPYLLELFKDADDQCKIEVDNLEPLTTWLSDCKKMKLSKKVSKFSPKDFMIECK